VTLWLPAAFSHPSFFLAIHFDNQLSTTTRTTTKDEDDLEPEVQETKVLTVMWIMGLSAARYSLLDPPTTTLEVLRPVPSHQ
jgi:hypothetical protein